ncbi:MAG: hypothetical protein HRT89_21490 [Lentisphaeria bacterium]|nr:hypothetical protein [Lentisphaeria bacterium]
MQKLIITFILGLSILVAQDAKEVEKKDAPAKEEKADDTKKPADTKEADAKPDAAKKEAEAKPDGEAKADEPADMEDVKDDAEKPVGKVLNSDESKWGLSGTLGTLGAGLYLHRHMNDSFNLRTGFNFLSASWSGDFGDIEYDFDLDLSNVALLVDWHPMQGNFRVSAGFIFGDNTVDIDANIKAASIVIGGTTYTAGEVGSVTGEVELGGSQPYIGIGWGNVFGKGGNFSISFDLGVMFAGEPSAELTSSGGSLSGTPGLLGNLEQEVEDLESDLEDQEIYPVLMIGLQYRF